MGTLSRAQGIGGREVRLQDYLGILQRRYLSIVVTFLAVAGSTGFFIWQKPDLYRAFSTLVIEEEQSAFALAGLAEAGRPLGFYQGLLSSRSYLEETLDSIGIWTFRDVLPDPLRNDTLAMLAYIRDHISLGPTNFQSLQQFTATAATSELAYRMALYGTLVFRKRCGEVEAEQSRETVIQLEKQITIIRKKLEEAEKDFQAYRDRSGLSNEGMDAELAHLQEVYFKERTERTLREAEYEATKGQLEILERKITPPSESETEEVRKLRNTLRELEREKLRLLSLNITISPSSPLQSEINTIEQQILQAKGKSNSAREMTNPGLVNQWQALRSKVASQELEIEFSKKRLASYRSSIEEYRAQHPEIVDQIYELSRLDRARKIYEETYNLLLGKVEEAKIRGISESGRIKIIDPAYRPGSPIPKNSGRFYAAGIVIGILLGFGLAFFVEFNDTTVKTSEDIERFLNLPVIGTIPHIVVPKTEALELRRSASKSRKKEEQTRYPKNLLNFSNDESIASEAYRSLRTNLLYSSPDKPIRSLVMTSSGPGEGKSLTVTNVALAYAQMGSKVLLVDTDLRRPVVHHLFQIRREPGFCELFLPNPDWSQIVRPSPVSNLSIIPAGRFTPSPAELIGAHKMDNVLEQMKERFDIIFFDTPPLVAVTDATLLSKKVDGVVLVVKSRRAERELTKRAVGILSSVGVKVIGAVLNDIDLSHRYSGYGYYKYYYHYYRSKKD